MNNQILHRMHVAYNGDKMRKSHEDGLVMSNIKLQIPQYGK